MNETEESHQAALFEWAAMREHQYPELRWLHHIPNGGSRGDNPRSRAIHGAKLKAQGVKSGIADVFLPVARNGFHGLYIEMKAPALKPKRAGSAGGLSAAQANFGYFAHLQGYDYRVCYDWIDASVILEDYLEIEE